MILSAVDVGGGVIPFIIIGAIILWIGRVLGIFETPYQPPVPKEEQERRREILDNNRPGPVGQVVCGLCLIVLLLPSFFILYTLVSKGAAGVLVAVVLVALFVKQMRE